MPYLTLSIDPTIGALTKVLVEASIPRQRMLRRSGHATTPRVEALGLIDTGASLTCIDQSILAQLGLPVKSKMRMHTPSTGKTAHQTNQYDVAITLLGPRLSFRLGDCAALSADLNTHHGFHVLIGRDVLKNCLLVYDGRAGTFSLAY